MYIGNNITTNNAFSGTLDDIGIFECVPEQEVFYDSFFDGGWHDGDCGTLNVEVNITQPDCGNTDGEASLDIYGGSGEYSILWSTGDTSISVSGLPAGNYSVQVTDLVHDCNINKYFTITNNSGPTITIDSALATSCNGSTDGKIVISITPDNNISPGQILWSNGYVGATTLTNLSAGIYSVTVTDNNGCIASENITINEPDPIEITFVNTSPDCATPNGSIDATVTGGTPDYTYQWSNNETTEDITNIPSGSYVLSVTDANACSAQAIADLNDNGAPIITIDSIIQTGCNADTGAIFISVNNVSGSQTYLWSNNETTEDINNLSAGIYTLTVNDNNCIATINAEIESAIHRNKKYVLLQLTVLLEQIL